MLFKCWSMQNLLLKSICEYLVFIKQIVFNALMNLLCLF